MAIINHPAEEIITFSGKTQSLKLTLLAADLTPAADTHDFSDHVAECSITPTVSTGSWVSASGKTYQDSSSPTWNVSLGIIQDLAVSGLMAFLLANSGLRANLEVTFAAGGPPITIQVSLAPSNLGGAPSGAPYSATVSLAADGSPTGLEYANPE